MISLTLATALEVRLIGAAFLVTSGITGMLVGTVVVAIGISLGFRALMNYSKQMKRIAPALVTSVVPHQWKSRFLGALSALCASASARNDKNQDNPLQRSFS